MIRSALGLLLIVASLSARAGDPEFSVDVMSVLSKSGCNLGSCHGNLNGKGGLQLSFRGQDAVYDYRALVLASSGRRVNSGAPEFSLLLKKASGSVAHGGGTRFTSDSAEYQLLRKWLQSGASGPSPEAPKVIRLDVHPTEAIVVAPASDIQFRIEAFFSDGTSRDVTDRACYELSNLNATVDASGRVYRERFGETTLIVRYLQTQVGIPVAFTAARQEFQWNDPPTNNEIDTHVFAKLKRLRVNPSPLSSDSVFVRRAHLDAIGRLPTSQEARRFVSDDRPGKRSRLIDQLLARSEFADFWAMKWADVLRTEEKVLDTNGVEAFHAWIRDGIATAKPIDQFVRDLVTGTGSTFEQPAANYYRANRDPSTRGETTARLFLGTRLQCAKCHNHPFDHWTQDDYYRWSSLFSQIDYQLGDNKRKDKLDKNEFAGDQVVLVAKQDEVRNPTTGRIATPKFLGGDELLGDLAVDRLASLASWLTSRDNDLFAQSQTNFIWYHVMGQGLVDPIDDFRMTNPASNPPLLAALTADLKESDFDLRSLVRKIMNSRTYQLSAEPNSSNVDDLTSYSRAYLRRLPAEVILDMQSDVLETPAEFAGYRRGMRAVQIPGVKKLRTRNGGSKPGDRFLKTFGKPERILACECERSNETTLKQVFSLIGDGLSERIAASDNRLQHLASSAASNADVIEELYWTTLARPPNDIEQTAATELLEAPNDYRATSWLEVARALIRPPRADRAIGMEDLAWALLNAKEFLFRR